MPRFARRNHGKSHSYTLDGAWIPGVTTVIGLLDKPALVEWAAKETAAYADEHWSELSSLRSADRIERLVKARYATNRRAIVKGNRVHNLGEKVAHHEAVEVPAELRSQVEAYARFLDRWNFATVATETPCCNTEYGYAGTFDLVVDSPRFGRSLMDIKTGKGVYSEVGLQLNAYASADLRLEGVEKIGPRGGKTVEWVEREMPKVDSLLVAHVLDDEVELVPVKLDPAITDSFLYLLEVFQSWHRRTSWDYRDDDAFDPPVGRPIWPEDVAASEGVPF